MSASDAPVREPGTRARSGNAMARTREALLGAAGECVARYGIRKTTMVDVASHSRVAKATLYNHFRTKEDLLVALVEDRVARMVASGVAATAAEGLDRGLSVLAQLVSDDVALRRASVEEPALLAPLARPSEGRAWQLAREGVAVVLAAGRVDAGEGEVELVLRWLTSQLLWPGADRSAVALARALGAVPAERAVPAEEPAAAAAPALGWPAG